MKKYRIFNSAGFGKSVEQKVQESFNYYGFTYSIIGGENAAYGNHEYIDIETNQLLDSKVMQSIAYNNKIIEI